ncbi:hypothetical protein BH10PSE6_BH10PSE6_41620 [soil metagenome]
MAEVNLLVALGRRRLHRLREGEILFPQVATALGDRAGVAVLLIELPPIVKRRGGHRPDLVDHPVGRHALARPQHAGVAQRRGVEVVGEGAAHGIGALAHGLEALLQPCARLVVRADAAVAVGARAPERQRAVGGDIDRYRMLDIDKAPVGMQEADLLPLAVQLVLDLLAVQEGTQHTQILAEGARLHRVLAHHAHRGVAGADAEEGAAGRELVNGGDRVRRDRGESHRRHGDAGAEPDARGVGRRERQHRIGVRVEHLRIGRPGAVVAHRLEVDEELPVRDARNDGDTEFHGDLRRCGCG